MWAPAMTTAEERGEVVSEVLRRCLSAYTRDPDGLLVAVTCPALDGPAVPRFSHALTAPTPWRRNRALGQPCADLSSPQQV